MYRNVIIFVNYRHRNVVEWTMTEFPLTNRVAHLLSCIRWSGVALLAIFAASIALSVAGLIKFSEWIAKL